ncbi:MAG TPA: carbohydrate porin [Puia sp.]|nr:carbohydrate porin [Puia sp.]
MKRIPGLIFALALSQQLISQQVIPDSNANWSVHFQMTVIDQIHTGFHAAYSGANSFADTVEPGAVSVTSTLFLGRRLWRGASFYFNPELSGGRGLSSALGIAGALNGETYRIGDPSPVVSVARAYIQQTIPLGGDVSVYLENAKDQVAGKVPARRLVISAGKFSMADFFDNNSYSHDPRTQFLNWSLMSNGAWDYPANIKGYTMGAVVEWINPGWAMRVSSVAVPVIANHSEMEYKLGKAHCETVEFQKDILLGKRPGIIRLLYSFMASRAPSYRQGLEALTDGDTTLLQAISGNAQSAFFGGNKTGLGLNIEQAVTDDIGVFMRAGWNDGKHVTWAFTEIDQTFQTGLNIKGAQWKRKEDVAGIAGVVNGISPDHRSFLKAGGYGFIVGDGALNYGHESVLEAYYNAKLFDNVWLSADYELVHNPGYNKDRKGPVHVFGVRGHVEF